MEHWHAGHIRPRVCRYAGTDKQFEKFAKNNLKEKEYWESNEENSTYQSPQCEHKYFHLHL